MTRYQNYQRVYFVGLTFLTIMYLAFFHQTQANAEVSGPQQLLEITVDKVLAIVTDKGYAGDEFKETRVRKIMDLMRARFDFVEMSRRTLAQEWRSLSPDQQKKFVELFSKILEKTYASKVDSYSSEKVQFNGQEIRDDKAVVESVIMRNDTEIPMVYKLLKKADDWFVYDVVIEGVSLVSNYRSQFQSIMVKEKYDGLIKRLEDRYIKEGNVE